MGPDFKTEAPPRTDESNPKVMTERISLQKDLNDAVRAQLNLYKDLGHENLSLEQRAVKRGHEEYRIYKQIEANLLLYSQHYEASLAVDQEVRDKASAKLKSIEEYNLELRKQLALLRLTNDFEKDAAKATHDYETRYYRFAWEQAEKMFGLKIEEYNITKAIGSELRKLGNITSEAAYTIGIMVAILKGAYDLFLKFDKAAWEFRKAMGATRPDVQLIRDNAEKLAIEFAHIGVTADGIYKAYQALGKQVGGVHMVSLDLVKTTAVLQAQLGISEELSAIFMRNMAAVSKSSMEAQQSTVYMTQNLASAAGVPLADVMGDVANKSNTTLLMMSRLPAQLYKSAVELRRMGTNLGEAARSSHHILQFSENIKEEMDASVLLGRSINLQRARELAYRRDIEGSTKEILRITKQIGFAGLDVFQQEAYAQATGKSVDELLRMLQADRQIEDIRLHGTSIQRKALENYEAMRRENERTAKARAQDFEYLIMQRSNQERLTAITQKWAQIWMKIESPLLNVVDLLLTAVIPVLDIASGLLAWGGMFKIFGPAIAGFVELIIPLGKLFSTIGTRLAPIGAFFGKIGMWVVKIFPATARLFGFLSKFGGLLGLFAEWIPVIGWVILAFQYIYNLIARMKGIGDAFNKSFVDGVIFGFKAVWGTLYDTLIKPFVDAFEYIWHLFGANSPSLLGMGILKGIVSIGTLLFDALISPFRLAFTWIMDKFSGLGRFFGSIFGRGESVEKKATAAYIPAVTVTSGETKINPLKETGGVEGRREKADVNYMTEETGQKMVALLEKILAKNIDVNLDGQKVSTYLSRNVEFRGSFGTNR